MENEVSIKVTIWNEGRHEKLQPDVAAIYPSGIHGAIAAGLENEGFAIRCVSLDDPEEGLDEQLLDDTDVLLWWGHIAHEEVSDALVDRIQQRVLKGMGLIVLHSGHHSKLFRRLMGTNCNLAWRELPEGDLERVWVIRPSHPIAEGLPPYFEVPQSEMYGEPFDIPTPEELIFLSWFKGGEVFRSGCTFQRGRGRIFFFGPGHETFPIYHNAHVHRVIANYPMGKAAPYRWAYFEQLASRGPNSSLGLISFDAIDSGSEISVASLPVSPLERPSLREFSTAKAHAR